jgi:hypothetical protein
VTYISVPVQQGDPFAPPGGVPRGGGEPSYSTAQRTGRAEPATSSVRYSSITYTTSEISQEPIPLSELIEISREGLNLSYPDWLLSEKFREWAKITENYWISAKIIKPNCRCIPGKSWGYSHAAQPLHTRFSLKRRSRKLAIVYQIMEYEKSRGTTEFTLLTLTATHEGGWRATMDRLREGRDKLLKLVRKHHPDTRYVWVGEPHDDKHQRGNVDLGFPHFHIVLMARIDNTVKDSQGRGLEDKLREYWSEKWDIGSHTFGLDFEVIADSYKALNYILKYVGKSYANKQGWTKAELIFNMNLYGAMSDEIDPKIYRTFGMSTKAYRHLFPPSEKEDPIKIRWSRTLQKKISEKIRYRPNRITLDARLFPVSDEANLPEKNCMKDGPRPQLIPDWLGNINLIESILKGSPDYATRPKYDPKGKPFPRPPNHWGRPYAGLR